MHIQLPFGRLDGAFFLSEVQKWAKMGRHWVSFFAWWLMVFGDFFRFYLFGTGFVPSSRGHLLGGSERGAFLQPRFEHQTPSQGSVQEGGLVGVSPHPLAAVGAAALGILF